jgi:hypothetical protein
MSVERPAGQKVYGAERNFLSGSQGVIRYLLPGQQG